ncbi:AAA family ATPase [Corynebacterium gottingense]|uniref:AAA family ATPase n=1 Tax=Corynebacterium gottingense TaxID=2041036 RepID=UPI0038D22760
MSDCLDSELFNAPYVDEIHLASGETLEFKPGEVVVLVGPNNAGKSYFLKSLEFRLAGKVDVLDRYRYVDSIVEELKISWKDPGKDGAVKLLNQLEKYRSDSNQFFDVPVRGRPTRSLVTEGDVYSAFESESKLNELTNVFVSFDDVKDRLNEAEPQEQTSADRGKSLIQQAWDEPSIFRRIVAEFKRVFNEDLSFYNLGEGRIGLLLAPPLRQASNLMEPIDAETRDYMETSPKLWEQGYGMRSVVGLLLRIHASDSSIALLDEPEAFLHPPQASALESVRLFVCGGLVYK